VTDMEKLLVIVGCDPHDDGTPFVIGAFNEEYLNQLPVEDAEEQILALKKTWTHNPREYDWREIRVGVPLDAIDRAFDRVEIVGEVEEP
jgi:hypothetical protein